MEKTFNDKDGLIRELTDLASRRKFVFRGYSIQDQLKPNIIRNNATDIELELLNLEWSRGRHTETATQGKVTGRSQRVES